MDFETVRQTDRDCIAGTYRRYDVCPVQGKNATCTGLEGQTYVDFTSGIGVNSLGFADERFVRAVSEQAAKLAHISNLFYTLPQETLAKRLTEATGMQKVFFANSGAEANEGAIKAARKYSFDRYGRGRDKIVTLRNSFHGRTVTTLSATGQDAFHDYFFPFTEGFGYMPANDWPAAQQALDGTVCAVLLELIQGEGGVVPLERDFVRQVAGWCAQNDALLLIDEVQTGAGRTGKFLCAEHYGIQPDIVTMAKGLGGGLPIGAVLFGPKTAGVLGPGQHGTTFGGNPVCCAGANAVLDAVLAPGFMEQVSEKGAYLRGKLLEMDEVAEVRGLGLMLGVVLKGGDSAEVVKACAENGLLALTAKSLVRFLPPLTISYEELNQGVSIFSRVVSRR